MVLNPTLYCREILFKFHLLLGGWMVEGAWLSFCPPNSSREARRLRSSWGNPSARGVMALHASEYRCIYFQACRLHSAGGEAAPDAGDHLVVSIAGVIISAALFSATHSVTLLDEIWAGFIRSGSRQGEQSLCRCDVRFSVADLSRCTSCRAQAAASALPFAIWILFS